jgi:ubiquitin-like protein Pup
LPDQERSQKKKTTTPKEPAEAQTETTPKGAELKERMDEVLDEIDEVLEENAEEFIKSYVQKGGE